MFNIEEELKKLPKKPGVYIMHDKNDKIIYVGKAINLKRRVTSYFRKTNKTQRILNMVALIDHFEYIVCDNEAEALILECNLIKKNMPKFNVLLKDGKTYPYIKINVKADYPDVYITRKILNDGARYFGPYANPGAAKEMVDFIKSKFKIRQCKNFKYNDRPCLNYHIKKCLAPCMGYVSKEEYRKQIDQIISILEGRTEQVQKELTNQMNEASKKLEFEKAAQLRDELVAVERISQRQKVSNISDNDIDVIGIARNEQEICVEILYIRNSKMIGRDNFFLKGLNDEEDEEIISQFMKQYYTGRTIFPNKIMCRNDFEERELLEMWFTQESGRKVEIKVPQKGEKIRLVEMAENNAKISLDNKEKAHKNVIVEMKDTLKLDRLPRKIESYDISNISGQYMVAGMCVMIDGMIKKNLARRFRIKTVFGQDDPRCMEEVITRRLRHSIDLNKIELGEPLETKVAEDNEEYTYDENQWKDEKRKTESIEQKLEESRKPLVTIRDKNKFDNLPEEIKEKYSEDKGFGRLPDLILADGGITQIRATLQAIKNIENEIGVKLGIRVFGMVKNDKHQTRALMDEYRHEVEISEELFNLITNFQNSVHDTAIGYHKFLRDKSMYKSQLDEISGIGTVKKLELLKQFGSVEEIKNAEIEELVKVKGINEELAIRLKNEL